VFFFVELNARESVHLRDGYPFCIPLVTRHLRVIRSTLLLYLRLRRATVKHIAQQRHNVEERTNLKYLDLDLLQSESYMFLIRKL